MSTRVEGAEPPVILITAKATLAAGTACLMLTVTQESGDLWWYNLSERKNSRLAYGEIIVPGHVAALRRAAQICADGYQPGTIERGLLDAFAQDAPLRAPPDVSSPDRPRLICKPGPTPRRLPRTSSPAGRRRSPPQRPDVARPRRQRGGLPATMASRSRVAQPRRARAGRRGPAGLNACPGHRPVDGRRAAGCQARPGVLAAIRICPPAATKKTHGHHRT